MKITKSCILFLLFFAQFSSAYAQPGNSTGTIQGTVLDQKTQKPLPGVNIMVEGTLRGTATNTDGNFKIAKLPTGTCTLVFAYIGYGKIRAENILIKAGSENNLGQITLVEEAITLQEIVVTPGSYSIMGDMPVARQTLSEEDIKSMAYAEDITRAVTRLPGISSNDYSSKFTIRGGEANEVLMVLDGMELYEPFHQRDFAGGLFSIVDVETIQGIDLQTGGFSAEYGNRQSGIFNMKSRDITDDDRRTSLGLSVMSASFYTDGTFANSKGSYLVSARRGLLDQAFKLIGEEERTPEFYDVLGKLTYVLSTNHSLSLHFLNAGDKTEIRDVSPEAFDKHNTEYGNTYGWLTLKSFYTAKLFSRTLLFGGLITHDRNGAMDKYENSDKLTFSVKDKRKYNFLGIKQDWNWDLSDRIFLRSGFEARQMSVDYDYSYSINELRLSPEFELVDYQNSFSYDEKPTGEQTSFYLTSRLKATSKLFLETGVRFDHVSYTNDDLWSPRLSFAYSLAENTFLRGAWGYYYQSQFMNDLDVNHNVTEYDPAELSKHYVLGLEHLFASGINLRLDGYFKDISRMSPTYQNLRDQWELFPESRNDELRLDFDGASAKGIELFLKYDTGRKISWWFSYAYAKAEEKVTNIDFYGVVGENLGTLPRANNQLHTVYTDMNYRPTKKWHLNLSWQYYTGWPITTYTFVDHTLDNGDLHFTPAHYKFRGEESPATHRMDVRINRYFKLGQQRLSTYLHVINVYNRENFRKWDLDTVNDQEQLEPNGEGGYNYFEDNTYFMTITPVLGVSWEF
ncbi:MAG: TonB-dependent receptor [Calditrichaeota bacterium]|nr:MAG: TonB-dependent receptor [Calditrichota bacterium]